MYLLLCLTLFAGATGKAANRHEHVILLPSFRDIWIAFHLHANPTASVAGLTGMGSELAEVRVSSLSGRLGMLSQIAELFGNEIANRVQGEAVFHGPRAGDARFGAVVDVVAAAIYRGDPASIRETVMASFFEMTSLSNPRDSSLAYRCQDTMRTHLLMRVLRVDGAPRAARLWSAMLTNYALRTPLADRMAFSFTVPHHLFSQEFMTATSRALEPAQCEFLLTLPRQFIERDGTQPGRAAELRRELERLRVAVRAGWAHGLDLTGSISEPTDHRRLREYAHVPFLTLEEAAARAELVETAIHAMRRGDERAVGRLVAHFPDAFPRDVLAYDAPRAPRFPDNFRVTDLGRLASILESRTLRCLRVAIPEDYREKANVLAHLRFICDELGGMEAQLRLHLYEGVRDGHLYRALRTILDEVVAGTRTTRLPTKIRVGHIAKMNGDDVAYFARVAGSPALANRLLFEVSPICNVALGRATRSSLGLNIDRLLRAGLKVVIGADGQGVFGNPARYLATLDFLQRECGLSESQVGQLHRNTMDTIDLNALRTHLGPTVTVDELRDLELFRIIHEDCSKLLARAARRRAAS